jgi:energy-coupling factor transporter ATP-binding protein EcfA2
VSVETADFARLVAALRALKTELSLARLGLDTVGAEPARAERDALVAQIDDYLMPRLEQMHAPLLIVVGGSTGAGKSTVVNSLLGVVVSPAGVLRPTTRSPVLACARADLDWFEGERILPSLPRTTGGPAGPGGLQLVATDALPSGLALLDSPDIDSVLAENRALASQLLAAADCWLFVTTAARYADAVPWDFLRAARERSTALALVLNRVPSDALDEVSGHLRQMLEERGLGGVELLVVPETTLDEDLIPGAALAPVRAWLDRLAADAQARAELIRTTLTGALDSLSSRVGDVERALEEQLAAADELGVAVEQAYVSAVADVEDAVKSGSLLRGEVLARWHEVVGTGDLMRALESRIGWLRDRVRSVITGRPSADAELQAAVESSLESVLRAAADGGAERAVRAWSERGAGRALLAHAPRLDRSSEEFLANAEQEVREWQSFVFELVRREGQGKRMTARIASLGVNATGLVVMLAVFVQTGGLTGAEVVIAGGTSAVGQKVLEAIFGDQAVRELAARAREDLLERVERLFAGERDRFQAVLSPAAPDQDSAARLRSALEAVERAR